jgi:hypothetical protein
MDRFSITCLILIGVLSIDFFIRLVLKNSQDSKYFSPTGISSLFLLCITQKQPRIQQKNKVTRQFFLSLTMAFFLLIVIHFLLSTRALSKVDALWYMVIFTPLFTLPFFHFIYNLIILHPLSTQHALSDFRLRGVISLIISANVAFISLEPIQPVLSIAGHFSLSFLAMAQSFYLCTSLRKKISSFHTPFQNTNYALPSHTMYYLSSIIECLYYITLVSSIFLQGPFETFIGEALDIHYIFLIFIILLAVIAFFVKYKFYLNAPISPQFYEETALPLSFLFFGLMSVFRYYF